MSNEKNTGVHTRTSLLTFFKLDVRGFVCLPAGTFNYRKVEASATIAALLASQLVGGLLFVTHCGSLSEPAANVFLLGGKPLVR